MKITSEKDEHGEAITVLRDVFSGVKFVTDSGHCLGVCMRDDGYEISVFDEHTNATPDLKKPVWFQVDPRTRTISRCEGLTEVTEATAPAVDMETSVDLEHAANEYNDGETDHYELREYADDLELIRKVLKTVGIAASHLTIRAMWKWYSARFQMSWAYIGDPTALIRCEVHRDFIESQKRRS